VKTQKRAALKAKVEKKERKRQELADFYESLGISPPAPYVPKPK
jgi:hypothetical protein